MKPLVKNREDYKPLLWIPKNVLLDIRIFENFSLINSEIFFEKNKLVINQKNDL
jgi:hypothetical protein